MKRIIVFTLLCPLFASINCSKKEDFAKQREEMVERQVRWRGITDKKVLSALLLVPREEFVLPQYRDKAYADLEVPVGHEQTLDRPYEDAFIVQSLKLLPSDKVLEIGTGGGYLTALMSKVTREVYSIEIIPELAEEARLRLRKLGYNNIFIKTGDGFLGWAEHAPFEAVVLTCSPPEIPKPLIEQLSEGGRLILPLGGEARFQELLLYTKQNGKLTGPLHLAPATFVPMKGKVLED